MDISENAQVIPFGPRLQQREIEKLTYPSPRNKPLKRFSVILDADNDLNSDDFQAVTELFNRLYLFVNVHPKGPSSKECIREVAHPALEFLATDWSSDQEELSGDVSREVQFGLRYTTPIMRENIQKVLVYIGQRPAGPYPEPFLGNQQSAPGE